MNERFFIEYLTQTTLDKAPRPCSEGPYSLDEVLRRRNSLVKEGYKFQRIELEAKK